MVTLRSPTAMSCLCFLPLLLVSSADATPSASTLPDDMSIINYNRKHRTRDQILVIYESWLVHHRKAYNALGENERRFRIFKDNLKFIDEHNAEENRPYKVGLNRFADMTNEEYRTKYLGTRMAKRARRSHDRYAAKDGDELSESVDWREKGAVNPVKDQGQCGE